MTVKIGNYNISDQDFKAYIDQNANNPAQVAADLSSIGGTTQELTNAYNQVYGGNVSNAQVSEYLSPTTVSTQPTVSTQSTAPTQPTVTNTVHIGNTDINAQDFKAYIDQNADNPAQLQANLSSIGGTTQELANAYNQVYGGNLTTQQVSDYLGPGANSSSTSDTNPGSNDIFSKYGFTKQQFLDYINTPGLTPQQVQSDMMKFGMSKSELAQIFNEAEGYSGDPYTTDNIDNYFHTGQLGDPGKLFSDDILSAYKNGIPQLFQPDKYPYTYQGLPSSTRDDLLATFMPQLKDAISNYNSNIDKYTQSAVDLSRSQSRDYLNDVLQKSLNGLSSRNMLNSSVASDTLGNATGEVGKNLSNQVYQSAMSAAGAKEKMPNLLSQVVDLGKYSESTNELAPFTLIKGLM